MSSVSNIRRCLITRENRSVDRREKKKKVINHLDNCINKLGKTTTGRKISKNINCDTLVLIDYL